MRPLCRVARHIFDILARDFVPRLLNGPAGLLIMVHVAEIQPCMLPLHHKCSMGMATILHAFEDIGLSKPGLAQLQPQQAALLPIIA